MIIANHPAGQSRPVLRAFQPWMYDAGLYVADDDFIVPSAYDDALAPIIHPFTPPGILPFESAIVRYVWTGFSGYDLDSRTSIENTVGSSGAAVFSGIPLGYDRPNPLPGAGVALVPYVGGRGLGGQILGPVGATYPPDSTNNFYLWWGGDNVGPSAQADTAFEACIINYLKFKTDFPTLTSFQVLMKAYWYRSGLTFPPYTGSVQISFETHDGGTYTHTSDGNFTWAPVNPGDRLVQTASFGVTLTDTIDGDPGLNGTTVGRLAFDITNGHTYFTTS